MRYDEINTIQDLKDNNIDICSEPRYYVGNKNFTGVPCTYFSNKNKAIEYLNWIKEFECFNKEELFFSDYGSLQYLVIKQKEWKLKYKPRVKELRQDDMFLTNESL